MHGPGKTYLRRCSIVSLDDFSPAAALGLWPRDACDGGSSVFFNRPGDQTRVSEIHAALQIFVLWMHGVMEAFAFRSTFYNYGAIQRSPRERTPRLARDIRLLS